MRYCRYFCKDNTYFTKIIKEQSTFIRYLWGGGRLKLSLENNILIKTPYWGTWSEYHTSLFFRSPLYFLYFWFVCCYCLPEMPSFLCDVVKEGPSCWRHSWVHPFHGLARNLCLGWGSHHGHPVQVSPYPDHDKGVFPQSLQIFPENIQTC